MGLSPYFTSVRRAVSLHVTDVSQAMSGTTHFLELSAINVWPNDMWMDSGNCLDADES